MLITDQERLREEVHRLAERYGRRRSSLLPILEELKHDGHDLDGYLMQVVADQLSIHPVEVESVASFYAFLKTERCGQFMVRLCRSLSCDLANKDRVARQLENDLDIPFGKTTPDGKFTLEWVNCLGMCDQGPALLVNDRVFPHVTPARVDAILNECRRAFGPHALEQRQEKRT